MVVGTGPPRHGDPARPDNRGHPVRLGTPEARRSGAMADREGDRTGAERAVPVGARGQSCRSMSAPGGKADIIAQSELFRFLSVAGHFQSLDQTAGAMRTRVSQSEVKSAGARRNRSDRNGVYGKATP